MTDFTGGTVSAYFNTERPMKLSEQMRFISTGPETGDKQAWEVYANEVAQLEAENKAYKEVNADLKDVIKEQRAEIERLREIGHNIDYHIKNTAKNDKITLDVAVFEYWRHALLEGSEMEICKCDVPHIRGGFPGYTTPKQCVICKGWFARSFDGRPVKADRRYHPVKVERCDCGCGENVCTRTECDPDDCGCMWE